MDEVSDVKSDLLPESPNVRFSETLTPGQLKKFFTLDQHDLNLVQKSGYNHTRLGIAIQVCTLKFLGTFLIDPIDVPEVVIHRLTSQLGLKNVKLKRYKQNDDSRLRDRKRICDHLGYREFEGAPVLGVIRTLLNRLTLISLTVRFGLRTSSLSFERCSQNCCNPKVVVLVTDNLNTHKTACLYEAFEPGEARRLAERLEWHYTPEHGSWLNAAEIELSAMQRGCLDRRLTRAALEAEVPV
jgi:Domain of unknown function (DUF4158)/DDE superfamily endonuclease